MRQIITLSCEVCKERNYTSTKNRQKNRERITLQKYCKKCRKHTSHRETR